MNKTWSKFRGVVEKFFSKVTTDTITWVRYKGGVDEWGEGEEIHDQDNYEYIELPFLLHPPYIRTWTSVVPSATGDIDQVNKSILLLALELKNRGYLLDNQRFNFSPDHDRFILHGVTYKPVNDTLLSPSGDSIDGFGNYLSNPLNLLIQVSLEREEIKTGESRFNSTYP